MTLEYNSEYEIYMMGITQATRHMNFAESIQYTFIYFRLQDVFYDFIVFLSLLVI